MTPAQKFIVWDWNGALLDDTEVVLSCVNTVLSRLDHPPLTIEKFRATQIRPLEKFYRDIGLTAEQADMALEHERAIFHETYEPLADHAPLRDGAADLLDTLKQQGVTHIVVSNHITDQIVRIMKQRAIHHHFDDVLAYENHGKQFRDRTKGEKLRAYMDAKGLNPANAVIIGDTLEEIEIARTYGMISVAITGGIHAADRLLALQPNYLIQSLHELPPILRQYGFVS